MEVGHHFVRKEFECRCGCGFDDVSLRLVTLLDALRELVNEPIHVLSGCRCSKHNKRCGGVVESQHLKGTAADIRIDSLTPKQFAYFIEHKTALKFGGLGIYSTFIHVDVREGHARWHG